MSIKVTGKVYDLPCDGTKVRFKDASDNVYPSAATVGPPDYAFEADVPADTRLAPEVRNAGDTAWISPWAPQYTIAKSGYGAMVICISCEQPFEAALNVGILGQYTAVGQVRNLPIDGTRLQFRDKRCESDAAQCETNYWFKTGPVLASQGYLFSVTLEAGQTYSIYHRREVAGVVQWVKCKSPSRITLEGVSMGTLRICVDATEA